MKHVSSVKLATKMTNNNRKFHRWYKLIQHLSAKITGLAPWTMTTLKTFSGDRRRNVVYSISYIGILYNILLFFGIAGFGVYRILDNSMNEYANSLLRLLIMKLLFITLISASFIPLIYIIRQKLILKANSHLKSVDNLLNKCVNYKLKKSYINDFIYIINILTNIAMIVLDFFYYPVINVFFESIPSIISSGVIIQYAINLNKINRRFSSISSAISKLPVTKSTNLSVTQIVSSRASILHAVDRIKRAYIELCEMCEALADFYGISILIAIFSFSVRAFFTLYFSILSIVRLQIFSVAWHLFGLRIIFTAFLFITLTFSVTAITKQNKKLALTINSQTDLLEVDEKIEKNLAKFAADLWHLKMEVTACNIVPLDRTLLGIVTGTVATYLVIGVQFAMSSRPTKH